MKPLLLILGGMLALVNAGIVFYPDPAARLPVHLFSGLCGLAVMAAAFRLAAAPAREEQEEKGQTAAVPAPAPIPVAPPRPEAEIVAFLALLQEKARLVDFAREEIAGASDEQVGAAARVVHAGCRAVLDEYFEIAPVRTEQEGTPILLPAGYDASAHRLVGSVPDQPPYRGRLMHPGWAARSVKLPRVVGVSEERPWPVLAPAEVEIAKS